METVPVPTPDLIFWYTVSGILGAGFIGLLIFIALRFINSVDKLIETVAAHEVRHKDNEIRLDNAEKDIEDLQEQVFPINYNKKQR